MKLYMHAGACSLSPHIVARELDLPIELIDVDRKTHRTRAGEDYLAINPHGYVPLLGLDDGTTIMEGPAIVQYLADLRPQGALAPPAGTRARTALQTWLNFITSELHKPLAMLMAPEYQPAREPLAHKVGKRLDWVAAQLTGDYVLGAFSAADPYLFTVLNWTPLAKIDLQRWPTLIAYQRRVAARPAVQAALAAEGLKPFRDTVFFAPDVLAK